MFGFENTPAPEPTQTEVVDQLLAHVLTAELKYLNHHKDEKVSDDRSNQDFSISSAVDLSVNSFGAIKHMDIPRGYILESASNGGIGGGEERIFRAKDGDSIIVASKLKAPLVLPQGEAKLKAILAAGTGSLTDAQRAEACTFLAKFGDNQYKPGNSMSNYGDAWKAPSYFVRSMEVREINGTRVLAVDGAYTPAPWKPEDGLSQAKSRFSAAFILGSEGVQIVYLEAQPQNYNLQENRFLQALKKTQF